MSNSQDTIAAVATPPGRGAIAIVRISGAEAATIAHALTGEAPSERQAKLCSFSNQAGEPVDQGLVLFFPGPRSFTGEDVVELHGHGGTIVTETLLAAVLAHGARPAEPGEFALRAFLNDKLDLTQAEAIADLIDSGSQAAARAALRSLEGRFSDQVQALQAQLTEIRVHSEAWLDFPDEELDLDDIAALQRRLESAAGHLHALLADARQGAILRSGLSVVIAGPPNAGKSSLLNRLAGYDAAIVTHIPGTTRDPLKEHISLDGLPINLIDTAGLRESADPIEVEGMRRSRAAVERADCLLWVVELNADLDEAVAGVRETLGDSGARAMILENKVDLTDDGPTTLEVAGVPVIRLSALTGEGLPLLIEHLKTMAGYAGEARSTLGARTRHVAALERARAALDRAQALLQRSRALELAAEELRGAQTALSEITGEITSDDLLGEIFGTFCIGK
jgi:tRNA modification GTPase